MNQRSIRRLLAGVLVVLLAGCSVTRSGQDASAASSSTTPAPATSAPQGAAGRAPEPAGLRAAVTVQGIRAHLAAPGGGRPPRRQPCRRHPWVRRLGGLCRRQLRAAGYEPEVQRFQAGRFRERSGPILELAGGGGSGPVPTTAPSSSPAAATSPPKSGPSTCGCCPRARPRQLHQRLRAGRLRRLPRRRGGPAPARHLPVPGQGRQRPPGRGGRRGDLQRGPGRPDRRPRRDPRRPGLELPVVAASFEAGRRLAEAGPGQRLRVRTDTESSGTPTSNVLVELPGADPGRVVMAGGHLDSVTAGPGINDNASGSATLLEIARQLAGTRPTPSGSRGGAPRSSACSGPGTMSAASAAPSGSGSPSTSTSTWLAPPTSGAWSTTATPRACRPARR